ncbi:radical SAM protein [Kaistella sp.]|uniref:radical SAM protein n=1 Tax=Kaistella sp. TaxID=2782235 RepID=UPI003C5F6F37
MFKNTYYKINTDVGNDTVIYYSSRSGETIALESHTAAIYEREDYDNLPDNIFSKLLSSYLIVPSEENELEEVIQENKNSILDSRTLYQVIQPTANCQLGCGYCGQNHTKALLNDVQMDAIVDRVKYKLEKENKFKTLEIGWFGAEPLMGLSNIRSLTPRLKKLADDHNLDYSSKMTTNGLSLKLNVFLDLVKNHHVQSFEITLDGTEEFHDKRRFLKSGEKSYNIIMENLISILNYQEYEKLNVGITIRCNVDQTNDQGANFLIDELKALGLNKKIKGFYVAPIHSWGNDAHLKSLEVENFADKEIDWLMYCLKNEFSSSILPARKKQTCMAVDPAAELVDAYGNIYNCTEISYVPTYDDSDYILGNLETVSSDNLLLKRHFIDWYDLIKENKSNSPCHSCKILPVCGGACPKTWKEGIFSCPSIKFNIEDRIALSYLISQKGLEIFDVF